MVWGCPDWDGKELQGGGGGGGGGLFIATNSFICRRRNGHGQVKCSYQILEKGVALDQTELMNALFGGDIELGEFLFRQGAVYGVSGTKA